MWVTTAITIHSVEASHENHPDDSSDEDLVKAIDRLSKQLNTSRTAFARKALRETLARHSLEQPERKHRQGYARQPVAAGELSHWEAEQVWGDK